MTRIQLLRNNLENSKGRRDQIQSTIHDLSEQIYDAEIDIQRHEEAREILRIVGLETQQQLQYHISDITSLALESVFPDPYELVVEFVQRRNKTECDLLFSREGELVDPLSATGGGACDIASFALRIASWSMKTPRSRATIILDEPMKNLSEIYQEQASNMIKELSEKLKLQFIIVTHNTTLAEHADKIFTVSIDGKGRSITKDSG